MYIPLAGNPTKAFPRYAQIVNDARAYAADAAFVGPRLEGVVPLEKPADYHGNMDKFSNWLGSQPGIVGDATDWVANNQKLALGALAAGTLANNVVGNPVGRTIDFLDLGLTHFAPGQAPPPQPQTVIMRSPSAIGMQPGVAAQVHAMTEEERQKYLKVQQLRTAQQLLSEQALESYLGSQPGVDQSY